MRNGIQINLKGQQKKTEKLFDKKKTQKNTKKTNEKGKQQAKQIGLANGNGVKSEAVEQHLAKAKDKMRKKVLKNSKKKRTNKKQLEKVYFFY